MTWIIGVQMQYLVLVWGGTREYCCDGIQNAGERWRLWNGSCPFGGCVSFAREERRRKDRNNIRTFCWCHAIPLVDSTFGFSKWEKNEIGRGNETNFRLFLKLPPPLSSHARFRLNSRNEVVSLPFSSIEGREVDSSLFYPISSLFAPPSLFFSSSFFVLSFCSNKMLHEGKRENWHLLVNRNELKRIKKLSDFQLFSIEKKITI